VSEMEQVLSLSLFERVLGQVEALRSKPIDGFLEVHVSAIGLSWQQISAVGIFQAVGCLLLNHHRLVAPHACSSPSTV
jgi:hypothetical protein